MLETSWNEHENIFCTRLNWEIFKNIQHAQVGHHNSLSIILQINDRLMILSVINCNYFST